MQDTTTFDPDIAKQERRAAINAPQLEAGSNLYPERYAIVFSTSDAVPAYNLSNVYGNDEVYTLMYTGRPGQHAGRTYLRDDRGIHTDHRWPADAVAETVAEAQEQLHIGGLVAVPVSVAKELLPDLDFAASGVHPWLGGQFVL